MQSTYADFIKKNRSFSMKSYSCSNIF